MVGVAERRWTVPKFRRKQAVVEAVQCWKHGDHPAVEPFPRVSDGRCVFCGHLMTDHGRLIAPNTPMRVCPGEWIVPGDGKHTFRTYTERMLAEAFEPVEDVAEAIASHHRNGEQLLRMAEGKLPTAPHEPELDLLPTPANSVSDFVRQQKKARVLFRAWAAQVLEGPVWDDAAEFVVASLADLWASGNRPANERGRPRCEDIGFEHLWQYDEEWPYDTPPPPPRRKCRNCGRVEKECVVVPAQEEVREWREVRVHETPT